MSAISSSMQLPSMIQWPVAIIYYSPYKLVVQYIVLLSSKNFQLLLLKTPCIYYAVLCLILDYLKCLYPKVQLFKCLTTELHYVLLIYNFSWIMSLSTILINHCGRQWVIEQQTNLFKQANSTEWCHKSGLQVLVWIIGHCTRAFVVWCI